MDTYGKAGVHRVLATLVIASGILSACSAVGDDTAPADSGQASPSVADSPIALEFPMFPDGASPSTPSTGEAVLEFVSWPKDRQR